MHSQVFLSQNVQALNNFLSGDHTFELGYHFPNLGFYFYQDFLVLTIKYMTGDTAQQQSAWLACARHWV
jgi:hypothetical protein